MILLGWLASIGANALNFISAIPSSSEDMRSEFGISVSTLVAIWLWMCAVQDVCTCLTLFFLLRQAPVRGIDSTIQQRLRRLSTLVLRSGAPTAAVALLGALLGTIFHHPTLQTVHVPFAFGGPLSSLYPIWLIACLDQRRLPHEPKMSATLGLRRASSSQAKGKPVPAAPPQFAPQLSYEPSPQQARSVLLSPRALLSSLAPSRPSTPTASKESEKKRALAVKVTKTKARYAQGIVITTEMSEKVEMDEDDWQERSQARGHSQQEMEQTSKLYNAVFS